MRLAPNLKTAIEYCKDNGIEYKYIRSQNHHFKFYVANIPHFILICCNKDNRDKVVKDIKKVLDGIKK